MAPGCRSDGSGLDTTGACCEHGPFPGYPRSPRNARCTTGLSIGNATDRRQPSFALWAVRAGCSVKRDLSTASAHLVLNFRDAAPPSPLGALANATPRRFPLRLITGNLSSLRRGRGASLYPHPRPSSFAYRASLNGGEARSRLVAAIRPSTSARYRTRGQR
jgi:hypothetical protein